MPSREQHISLAEHNERFTDSFDLDATPYRDWLVTGKFYAAVHYVEAYLATRGEHSRDHRARDSKVKRLLPAIKHDYRSLKDESINARYFGYRFSADDVRQAISPALEAVRAHVLGILGSP